MSWDEPYLHGRYINTDRLNRAKNSFSKLLDAKRNLKESENVYLQQIEAKTKDCTVTHNDNVGDFCRSVANSLGMEPYALEYLLKELLPYLYENDEYVKKVLGELIVYAKLKEHTWLNQEVRDKTAEYEQQTRENLDSNRSTFDTFKDRYERRNMQFNVDHAIEGARVAADKEWLIRETNKVLNVTGNNFTVMSPSDRAIIQTLMDQNMIVQDGNYWLINQQKILFELSDAEYEILLVRIVIAVNLSEKEND